VPEATTINIYAQPSLDAEILMTVDSSSQLIEIGREGDWAIVDINGTPGYILVVAPQETEVPEEGTALEEAAEEVAETPVPEVITITLYAAPSLDSEVLMTIDSSSQFIELSREGDWAYVDFEGTLGYVLIVAPAEPETTEEVLPTTNAFVIPVGTLSVFNTEIPLYAAPSVDAAVLATMQAASLVTVISQDAEWALVDYQGLKGYVSLKNLVIDQPGVELNPSLYVWLASASSVEYGDTVVLSSKIVGLDGMDYTVTYQWQYAPIDWNGNVVGGWTDLPGANQPDYSYSLSESNILRTFQLLADVEVNVD